MAFKLAWRQLLAQWRAGELRVLLLALVVAISAITAVNCFTDRIALHLSREGALVLGGDMVLLADHAIPTSAIATAAAMRLSHTTTAEFPSMVIVNDHSQLAEIKALQAGFPLRGNLTVQLAADQAAQSLQAVPKAGTVWIEPRLADLLKCTIGDTLTLGASRFKVSGLLLREPSRGGDMFNFAPRLLMNATDLASTQLIQFGSRVRYQLLVAGAPEQVQRFGEALTLTLKPGEKIQDLKSARPEIRSALDKAAVFLGLAAMVTLVLSVAAMLLASGPYVARHMEVAALLRCFGASRQMIQRILLWQCSLLALFAAVVGCTLGYGLQYGLSALAGRLFADSLPAAGVAPLWVGFSISFLVMFALMLPHIQAIKNYPVMHILRIEIETKLTQSGLKLLPVFVLIALLFVMIAQSWQLALAMISGMAAICGLCALLAYALAHWLYQLSQRAQSLRGSHWPVINVGLANLKRHRGLTIVQTIGFSLSAMVLILLVIIKSDLIHNWQASLPADAPNRFMINIQPEQVAPVQAFQRVNGINKADLFPMVRGRLIAKNGQPVSAEGYEDARAKRLVSREFNLSMTARLQVDNRMLAGTWWQPADAGKPWLSIEHDIAEALGIKVGDVLTYDIAGSPLQLTVKSIRKVEWDSMRANFFAVTPPQTLQDFPMTYLTAFYLPANQTLKLNRLVQQFPNFTVIDVASLIDQVRDIMQKMSLAIAYVFALCLVAGAIVLYAALLATRESRIREASLLRVFGASKWQVSLAILTEYAGIALLVASMALLIANAVAFYISHSLFDAGYQFNLTLSAGVYVLCLVLIPLLAWLVLRRQLKLPPKQLLHSV